MATTRVYELAKRLAMESKDLLNDLQTWGVSMRSASSEVDAETVRRVEAHYRKGAPPPEPAAPAPALWQDNNPYKVPSERSRDQLPRPRPGMPPRPPRPPRGPIAAPPPPMPLANRISEAWPATSETGSMNESSDE